MERRHALAISFACIVSGCAGTVLSIDRMYALRETVRELCVSPDRTGDYLQVEGDAKAGLPVVVKLIKGNITGKVSYEAWKGIPITLDRYKTDPRECAVKIVGLLAPSFGGATRTESIELTTGQFWIDKNVPLYIHGGLVQLRASHLNPEPPSVVLEIDPSQEAPWNFTTPSTPRKFQFKGEGYMVRVLEVTTEKVRVLIRKE